jgi:MFS family permease
MRKLSLSIESPYFFSLATIFFSICWFWLSFTFPLKLVAFGFNYFDIGIIGTSASLPFILISFLYRSSHKRELNFAMKVPFLVMAISSFVLIFSDSNSTLFVVIIIFTGFFQSMWWVSAEIETGLLDKYGTAERYSAAWAIPSGIFPIFSGLMLQYLGYDSVFIFVFIISTVGLFIQPLEIKERVNKSKERLNYRMVVPMIFAGIAMGFMTFVLVPVIRTERYTFVEIGILLSFYGIFFATGSIIANFFKITNQIKFSILSCLLSSAPLILIFTLNFYTIALSLSLAGLGGSLGFSKILSYINRTEGPRDGVFLYESFFSIGYVSGTILGGFITNFVSFNFALLVFVPSVLYAIYLIYIGKSSSNILISGNFE